ncbi:hypothetical protein QTP70_033548 [Hemibagrus guttatus]|uniref:ribonuclease H n=1 Tax=Hemibagrus guttatus TaxID=175788 RepID=A0AAE0UYI3_9TELE|nr:hypothetical protein QTP70_033548 [Hemibagrus guttatus]
MTAAKYGGEELDFRLTFGEDSQATASGHTDADNDPSCYLFTALPQPVFQQHPELQCVTKSSQSQGPLTSNYVAPSSGSNPVDSPSRVFDCPSIQITSIPTTCQQDLGAQQHGFHLELEGASGPLTSRDQLYLPLDASYRDTSALCPSPCSSLSSRSWLSDASSCESFSHIYDDVEAELTEAASGFRFTSPLVSPQGSPLPSPLVSPQASPQVSPMVSPFGSPGCAYTEDPWSRYHQHQRPYSHSLSPHHSPYQSPRTSVNEDTWLSARQQSSSSSKPSSRPTSPYGKRPYSSADGIPGLSSPHLSPTPSPSHSPRGSVTDETWLGSPAVMAGSFLACAPDVDIPSKTRRTFQGNNSQDCMALLPGHGDSALEENNLVSSLLDSNIEASLPTLKKEDIVENYLSVPTTFSWGKPKQTHTPLFRSTSLPSLDCSLPSQYGQCELKLEIQPKPHHRAHYETEGSRGAIKSVCGRHPIVKTLEKDLYRLARQRDRDGKDVQHVRVIKDRDGRVLTSEESVQRRWKEYFEELMNEENEREKRVEGVNSVEQKVDKIRKDEVRKALMRMKSGKAVGPDDIPVEVWKCLGEAAVEFLNSLFNRVLESERMPEEWRRSVLVPIFKNKGDVQSCSNYRGIKLMSHTMKLWERVVEARLRKVVEICEQQYGFMPRKSTTDAIFALRILMEKYKDGQRELHCVFVDLEKAYDRVPREELWYCMRKSGVAEKYVRVVQDMYERSRTVVRCAVGQTEEFKVEVGLNQGSALSPFLFAIVMDQLSEEVRQESPWTMMFADDTVICRESREQVEESLERWRFALERRGMKVSRSKTEYMCVNEREGSGTVRLQGEEVKKVQEFKYLGSTVQSNGECGKELLGYNEKPVNLQMFIGTADDRHARPHAFYQVHRITGKTVATPSQEMLIGSTKILEIPLLPENNMSASIDCAGILKLRNSDIELRKGETDIGRKNTRVRAVFRVHIPQANGKVLSLQVASIPIECSQRSAQELPQIEKFSPNCDSVMGGHELLITGPNITPDSKVIFLEKGHDGRTQWEVDAKTVHEKSRDTTIVVKIPPYHKRTLGSSVQVQFYVSNGKRKRSLVQRFTYVPVQVKQEYESVEDTTTSDHAEQFSPLDQWLYSAGPVCVPSSTQRGYSSMGSPFLSQHHPSDDASGLHPILHPVSLDFAKPSSYQGIQQNQSYNGQLSLPCGAASVQAVMSENVSSVLGIGYQNTPGGVHGLNQVSGQRHNEGHLSLTSCTTQCEPISLNNYQSAQDSGELVVFPKSSSSLEVLASTTVPSTSHLNREALANPKSNAAISPAGTSGTICSLGAGASLNHSMDGQRLNIKQEPEKEKDLSFQSIGLQDITLDDVSEIIVRDLFQSPDSAPDGRS